MVWWKQIKVTFEAIVQNRQYENTETIILTMQSAVWNSFRLCTMLNPYEDRICFSNCKRKECFILFPKLLSLILTSPHFLSFTQLRVIHDMKKSYEHLASLVKNTDKCFTLTRLLVVSELQMEPLRGSPLCICLVLPAKSIRAQ